MFSSLILFLNAHAHDIPTPARALSDRVTARENVSEVFVYVLKEREREKPNHQSLTLSLFDSCKLRLVI